MDNQLNKGLVEVEKMFGDGSHNLACKRIGCCKGCYASNQYDYCDACYNTIMDAYAIKSDEEFREFYEDRQ